MTLSTALRDTLTAAAGVVALSMGANAAQASCPLSGNIQHVVYIQFDNVHLERDNPNVPSDLEQMPNLVNFIIFLREKRWPSGRRGIATGVARHVSHGPHFSMFSKVLRGDLLVYCMDVQLSTYRCSGSAPAGEGQARRLASRLGA